MYNQFYLERSEFWRPKKPEGQMCLKGLVSARQLTRGHHRHRRSRSSRTAAIHRSSTPSSLHTELHCSLKHTHTGRVWLNPEFLRCWCTKADKCRQYKINALFLNESKTEENCSSLIKSLYPGPWCFMSIALVVDRVVRCFWKEENLQKIKTCKNKIFLCSVIVPQVFQEIIFLLDSI